VTVEIQSSRPRAREERVPASIAAQETPVGISRPPQTEHSAAIACPRASPPVRDWSTLSPGRNTTLSRVNIEFSDPNGHWQTRTLSLLDAINLAPSLGIGKERGASDGLGLEGLISPVISASRYRHRRL
jgi:hypothetical protein